jgi:hypothetical protein
MPVAGSKKPVPSSLNRLQHDLRYETGQINLLPLRSAVHIRLRFLPVDALIMTR